MYACTRRHALMHQNKKAVRKIKEIILYLRVERQRMHAHLRTNLCEGDAACVCMSVPNRGSHGALGVFRNSAVAQRRVSLLCFSPRWIRKSQLRVFHIFESTTSIPLFECVLLSYYFCSCMLCAAGRVTRARGCVCVCAGVQK